MLLVSLKNTSKVFYNLKFTTHKHYTQDEKLVVWGEWWFVGVNEGDFVKVKIGIFYDL